MKTRVYIETTIPSFYYTLRTDTESQAMMNWRRADGGRNWRRGSRW